MDWVEDSPASARPVVIGTAGDVQTEGVTLTPPPVDGKLFVRVKAR